VSTVREFDTMPEVRKEVAVDELKNFCREGLA
jgi:hypothetical protein